MLVIFCVSRHQSLRCLVVLYTAASMLCGQSFMNSSLKVHYSISPSLRWDWAIATPWLFAFSHFTLEYFGIPRSLLNDCKVPRSCCCTRSQQVQMQFCNAKPCWYILFRLFFSETNAKMPYLFHVFSYCIMWNFNI